MIRIEEATTPETPIERKGEWFRCPRCHAKLFALKQFARVEGIEIKCRKCKKILWRER